MVLHQRPVGQERTRPNEGPHLVRASEMKRDSQLSKGDQIKINIDTTQGETVADKRQLITRVTLFVETSRGIWVGAGPPEDNSLNEDDDPLFQLREAKTRNAEGYDSPVDLKTDTITVNFDNGWNSHGRIFIRQVDPLPLSVLTVVPAGLVPIRG